MFTKHKRLAAAVPETQVKADAKMLDVIGDCRERVSITFLLPKAHAQTIIEAATFSGNLLCKNVIVADHLILAVPRFPIPQIPPSYDD
jgi:hypothetical protein